MERLKEKIENAMIDGNAAEAKGFIEAYEEKAPEDAELISMKVNYYLLTGDIEQAAYYGVLGIRRLPLNVDMHYNPAYIYEITEQYLEAFVHYARADYLCKYAGDSRFGEGEKYKPDYVVHGDDWCSGFQKPIRDKVVSVLASYGGRLVEYPYMRDERYQELENRARQELSLPSNSGALKDLYRQIV